MNDTFDVSSATGVDIQLNIAGPGARSYAFVIDWHIRLLLAMAWFAIGSLLMLGGVSLPDSGSEGYSSFVFIVLVPAGAIYALYHLVLEILMRGRTPGKRLAGIRIVTVDAQEASILAHIIRNLLRILDSLPALYAIGLAATMLSKNSVRIGDMAAGTVLVYDLDARTEKMAGAPVNAEAAERLGLKKAELLQDLLERWDSIDHDQRISLAIQLISKLAPYSRPAADADTLHDQLQALLTGEQDS